MGSNTVAVIVTGILGFLVMIIAGRWLFEESQDHYDHPSHRCQPPIQSHQCQPQIIQPQCQPPIIVQPPQHQPYPQSYPHYHSQNEFWEGYWDGWSGVRMRQNCPEYSQGYKIGLHDRGCNRRQYYDQYCPPGFSLRTPGFNLRIH